MVPKLFTIVALFCFFAAGTVCAQAPAGLTPEQKQTFDDGAKAFAEQRYVDASPR